jgi:hypothetical protein
LQCHLGALSASCSTQRQSLEQLKATYERRTGQRFPITFAKYTGDTKDDKRVELRQHPPQILLTNYVMAELMLVRPEDQRFLDRVGGGLRFLVFDELHTYRGRQGADVAMLIRRLKERAAAPDLIHIGTSATMVADRNASPPVRRSTVAKFAERLFGHRFTEQQVIEETLVRFTEDGVPSPSELKEAITSVLPATLQEFRKHPLARWAEAQFGVEQEEGELFKRQIPSTLTTAAERLTLESGIEASACETRLRELLTLGGNLPRDDGGRAFAFKLHQFIGQGRALFATLESAGSREFSLERQVQAGGGRIFVPIKFCRQCGQEYCHILRSDDRLSPHPLGFAGELDSQSRPGYLMLTPSENDWTTDRIPEEWREANGRLKQMWQGRVPEPLWVAPDGSSSPEAAAGRLKMWWQASPFSLCLSCGCFIRSANKSSSSSPQFPAKLAAARRQCSPPRSCTIPGGCRSPRTNCCHSRTIARTHPCSRVTSMTSFTCHFCVVRCTQRCSTSRS